MNHSTAVGLRLGCKETCCSALCKIVGLQLLVAREVVLKNWVANISAPVSTGAGNLTLTFKNFSMGARTEWENEATTSAPPKKMVFDPQWMR